MQYSVSLYDHGWDGMALNNMLERLLEIYYAMPKTPDFCSHVDYSATIVIISTGLLPWLFCSHLTLVFYWTNHPRYAIGLVLSLLVFAL
jgi:hypothetical protein